MKLELELDSERVAAGGDVRGRVSVLEGGKSRSLTVTLSFHERSPDHQATPFSEGGIAHEGDLATGMSIPFGFTLSADVLPGVKSKHGELWWEVEAHSDEPGLDTRVSRRVEVVAPDDAPAATFACSVCGKQAGALRLSVTGGRTEVRRESWPGVLMQTVGAAQLAELETALAARDVPALFAVEPELTPFYCPDCDASYCSDHWSWWDVWDDEWSGWRDSVRGRCPQGHERMLED